MDELGVGWIYIYIYTLKHITDNTIYTYIYISYINCILLSLVCFNFNKKSIIFLFFFYKIRIKIYTTSFLLHYIYTERIHII